MPEIAEARKALATQSREALLVEWLGKHHVHENLNPDTGCVVGAERSKGSFGVAQDKDPNVPARAALVLSSPVSSYFAPNPS